MTSTLMDADFGVRDGMISKAIDYDRVPNRFKKKKKLYAHLRKLTTGNSNESARAVSLLMVEYLLNPWA